MTLESLDLCELDETADANSIRDNLRHLISIVIPTFNEGENVERVYVELKRVAANLHNYDFEFLFTDNHSTDDTFEKLLKIAETDQAVRVVRFSRNFGFQRSVLAGYLLARGDAAIQIDADLQDPPSLFEQFLAKWHEGYDVVVGVRKRRPESLLLRFLRDAYYKLVRRLVGSHLIVGAGDFRLIDRSIIEKCRAINEPHMYLRGLISSFARRQATVPYDRSKRLQNKSKFRFRALLKLATDGILAQTSFPLKLSFYIGLLIAMGSVALAVFYIMLHLYSPGNIPRGFTTTQTLILFGIGLNGMFLGLIGAYIGRIYDQIRPRPLVIIADLLNFNSDIASVEKKFNDGIELNKGRFRAKL